MELIGEKVALNMGMVTFLNPWALMGLLALPLLWWIVRVTPPPERRYTFPPIRVFAESFPGAPPPKGAPPWLVMIRLLCAILAVLGLAQPVLNATPAPISHHPLLIIIDNGWSAAPNWDHSVKEVTDLLKKAETQMRPVQVASTARSAQHYHLDISTSGSVSNARELVKEIKPHPWESDLSALVDLLTTNTENLQSVQEKTETIWMTDGLEKKHQDTVLTLLKKRGPVTVIPPLPKALPPVILLPLKRAETGIQVTVRRPSGSPQMPLTLLIRAINQNENIQVAHPVTIEHNAEEASTVLPLDADDIPLISRVEVVSSSGRPLGAGAIQLTDDRWRHFPVGIVRQPGNNHLPLLAGTWYVERALSGVVPTHVGPLEHLLTRRLSTLILTGGSIPSDITPALSLWVERGGILIRFANDELSQRGDATLLPVVLRRGKRTLGGGLNWQPPLPIGGFRDNSPLSGLPTPPDVTISAQILAEPGPQTDHRTWAWLQDGTPLVTAARTRKGWTVLVHTSANTEWSTLPLSGLFPALLTRLSHLAVSRTNNSLSSTELLFPWKVLDGEGRLTSPGANVKPLSASQVANDTSKPMTQPHHPPGWYGTLGARHALSVARTTMRPRFTESYGPDVTVQTASSITRHVDLAPTFLVAAVIALLVDGVMMLLISGALSDLSHIWRKTAVSSGRAPPSLNGMGLILIGTLLTTFPQHTAKAAPPPFLDDALDSRLAWVATGDQAVDTITESGLRRLTGDLALRTAVEFATPRQVDPKHDPLEFYPLVYWPIAHHPPTISRETRKKIALYLDRGGLIIFDGRHPDNVATLQTFLRSLDLPPLQRLPQNHVLTRSFYLLPGLLGRFSTNGAVWIAHSPHSENVSPIIAGSVDWVGAWATDAQGHPLLPMIPPGEAQREMTVRSGINMVMYALTGTYKADQVHIPAILERLTQ